MSPTVAAQTTAFPIPLPATRLSALEQLIEGLDAAALQWLSGYVAGVAAGRAAPAQPAAALTPSARLTVLFGSQTGNARRLAERIGATAEAAGLSVRVLATGDYPRRELASERLLLAVISTQGEGDPPEDAIAFMEFLASKRAPELPQLRYSVLALGDSSYPLFCATGRQLDERLAHLGAQRLGDRADADVDFEAVASDWIEQRLAAVQALANPAEPAAMAKITALRPSATAFGRDRPFAAEVLANQRITGRGADKDVRHLELSLAGSGFSYAPGDALGIWPRNAPALVDAVLLALGLEGATQVTIGDRSTSLALWLREERELTRLGRPLLEAHARLAASAELDALIASDAARLLREWQPIDLFERFPARWIAGELVATLRPIVPRLYSIASSAALVDDEVHLTVSRVDYLLEGAARSGAASQQLSDSGEGDSLRVFIEPNTRFRLPEDHSRDIIMIGAGTGIAPYRAFLQQRVADGASGRNWLVFGERQARHSFLYQLEWQEALRRGELHRLDLAFSRDQPEKRYVQHALRDAAGELWSWIEAGATLYVCGDAQSMAPDVHAALLEIIAAQGALSADEAAAYLADLGEQRRYLRDIY